MICVVLFCCAQDRKIALYIAPPHPSCHLRPPAHGLFLPVAAAAAATLAAAARAWEVALATRAAAAARSEKLTGEWRCEALALALALAPVGELGVWWRALLLVALCVGE
jgi:hypothetical protein